MWPEFDRDKLHCLVVLSEYQQERSPEWGLTELVKDAVAGETGNRIWNAFCLAVNKLRLVSGRSEPASHIRAIQRSRHVFSSSTHLQAVRRSTPP